MANDPSKPSTNPGSGPGSGPGPGTGKGKGKGTGTGAGTSTGTGSGGVKPNDSIKPPQNNKGVATAAAVGGVVGAMIGSGMHH
jgi:hypothetical protein